MLNKVALHFAIPQAGVVIQEVKGHQASCKCNLLLGGPDPTKFSKETDIAKTSIEAAFFAIGSKLALIETTALPHRYMGLSPGSFWIDH